MIANEYSEYHSVALVYCEGRNDEKKAHFINSIIFARDFAQQCMSKAPYDVEEFLYCFYAEYETTFLQFKAIVGSQL